MKQHMVVESTARPALTQHVARAVKMLEQRAGILIGDHKQEMISRVIAAQAKHAQAGSVSEYLDRLESDSASPYWESFINAFTINHTAFFREEHHFDVLASFLKGRQQPLRVWSAACSTGEEAYSIAMSMHEALEGRTYQASVLATDIDTQAVRTARQGIYPKSRVQDVSEERLKRYFQRGRGARSGMVRVKDTIRNLVMFDALNLLSPGWPNEKFDAIFCRNTLIYFDKNVQRRILDRFSQALKPQGLLFVGHSENLTYLTDKFRLQGQTVYRLL